jgi:hypothetical protein
MAQPSLVVDGCGCSTVSQVVECAVNKVTVVPCHSIHALLSSLDELAQQATVEVRLKQYCVQKATVCEKLM